MYNINKKRMFSLHADTPDFKAFEEFKGCLNGAISFLQRRSFPNEDVPYEEFLTAMSNFVSITLQKLFDIIEDFYKKDKFFVFLPCGKLSQFFWEILKETQFLQLPIWNKLFLHPTMSFFQKSFLKNQSEIITYLKLKI